MLGDIVAEEKGKVTGVRVLPEGKVEASFQAAGRILGVEMTNIGTYQSSPKPGGVFYGEGQGIVTTKDGEMVMWTGSGIGRPTGRGSGVTWRYSVSFQTSSQKLARLNSVWLVGEFEADENGNTLDKSWEWK